MLQSDGFIDETLPNIKESANLLDLVAMSVKKYRDPCFEIDCETQCAEAWFLIEASTITLQL